MMPLAMASDPMEVFVSVYPVACWKAGPTWSCNRSCNEPADSTSTGPEAEGEAPTEAGSTVVSTQKASGAAAAAAIHRSARAPGFLSAQRVDIRTR